MHEETTPPSLQAQAMAGAAADVKACNFAAVRASKACCLSLNEKLEFDEEDELLDLDENKIDKILKEDKDHNRISTLTKKMKLDDENSKAKEEKREKKEEKEKKEDNDEKNRLKSSCHQRKHQDTQLPDRYSKS